MFQIMSQAKEMEKSGSPMTHFELGDPSFDTPWEAKAGVFEALIANKTHYAPSRGIPELLEIAQDVTEKSRGFRPTKEQLLVTPGANWQIYAAIACTCNPGDCVLVPDPGFVSYWSICRMLGVKAIPYSSVADIGKKLYKNKMIIVNSPNNPTGEVLSNDDVLTIYGWAKYYGMWILSDEIYARMIYEKSFASPSKQDACTERTIIVNGFSKSYAMTGWRLGVMTGPEELMAKCQLLLETEQSCVSTPVQYAGVEALCMSQWIIKDMVNSLAEKRHDMIEGLWKVDLSCKYPDGAFYAWVPAPRGYSGDVFAEHLLKHGVVVTPGSVFGNNGVGHIRICFAVDTNVIAEGLKKMAKAMEAL